jgi:hypothetical protein
MTEPQSIWVKVEFRIEHNPGNELHLKQLIKSALTPKGIEVRDDGTIVL